MLDQNLNESFIRGKGIDFGVVTISIPDLTPFKLFLEDIPKGKLVDYLLASASFPIFQLQRIGDNYFLDGGVYDNLPISMLKQKGFKKIIAVRLVSRRIWGMEKEDDIEITLIKPRRGLGNIFDFSRERIDTNIELGYYDTLKIFNKLYGVNYYVDTRRDEGYFLRLLWQMDQSEPEKIRQELGIPEGMPHRRFILERLVPVLVDLLPVSQNASYGELIVALLERAAEKAGIEKLTLHNYDDFERMIVKAHQPTSRAIYIPGPLKGNELLMRARKEPLLDDITDTLIRGIKQNQL